MENHLFITPDIFPNHIIAAQSTRNGGVSPSPFTSLNLGLYTKDSIGNVKENRKRFFGNLGFVSEQVAGSYQTHGKEVAIIEKAEELSGYDAFITNQKNILLAVTIADCTPILIYDPIQEVVAAIHAGWKGTVAKIVQETLDKMINHYNSAPKDCLAYIGSCIAECDFEVDADVADHFDLSFKRWDEEKGKFFVDLKKSNKAFLLEAGLQQQNIETSPYSTVSDNQLFFSHRKEKGKTGRGLAVIGMI